MDKSYETSFWVDCFYLSRVERIPQEYLWWQIANDAEQTPCSHVGELYVKCDNSMKSDGVATCAGIMRVLTRMNVGSPLEL